MLLDGPVRIGTPATGLPPQVVASGRDIVGGRLDVAFADPRLVLADQHGRAFRLAGVHPAALVVMAIDVEAGITAHAVRAQAHPVADAEAHTVFFTVEGGAAQESARGFECGADQRAFQ